MTTFRSVFTADERQYIDLMLKALCRRLRVPIAILTVIKDQQGEFYANAASRELAREADRLMPLLAQAIDAGRNLPVCKDGPPADPPMNPN